jgi:ubiquinone/menaquinone biosynthesis C-methylase UbiE
MTKNNLDTELSNTILAFHQKNYRTLEPHQPISDPKASYFQYTRYYGVLEEIKKLNFKNFLDVGCAEGMFLLGVKKIQPTAEVYGVDFSTVGLCKASVYSGTVGSLACADATHLPFGDNSFDLVLCSETLEHIVNDISAFGELQRVCKKTCIITVPSFNNKWAQAHFRPDVDCTFDSHLRKYAQGDLYEILHPHFKEISIYPMSLWYPSTFDIIIRFFFKKTFSSKIAHFLSNFASIDYRLSKAGAHGHSFICICKKEL